MTVEAAIYDRLSGYAGLTSLVGTRISPGFKLQDGNLPAVTYQRVTAQRFSAMSVDSGVVKARYQIDVWAATYASAIAVREAVRGALQRYNTAIGTTIYDVYLSSETDLYENDTKQYHIAMDFEVNYRET